MQLVKAIPELSGQRFIGELQSVWRTGESISRSGLQTIVYKDDQPQNRYFDYEIRALKKEDGTIYGLLNTAIDVTERVLSLESIEREHKQEQDLKKEQALNEELAATNEELTAINEELNRSEQNLQALNEELEGRVARRTLAAESARYRLEAMVMNTPIAMSILKGHDLIVEVANKPMLKVWRRTMKQVIGRGLVQIFPELRSQPNPERMRNVMRTGKRFSLPETEVILGTVNGELKKHYARFSYDPIFESDGTVGSVLITVIDITEEVLYRRELEQSQDELQRSSEELTVTNEELLSTNEDLTETQYVLEQNIRSLAESESRFRQLVRDATVGIVVLNGVNCIVSIVNNAYGKLVGRSVAELQDRPIFHFIPGAETIFRPIIDQVRKTGDPVYLYDQPYELGENGLQGFLNLVYQPYRERDGEITGVMVLCQDVSNQVIARQQLESNEKRLRFLLDAIPQQVWTATPDGELDYVNEGVSRDFDQPAEVVVGQGWQAFVHPDDLPQALEKWSRSLKNKREYLTEFRLKFADGEYYWHLAKAVPLIEKGQISLWIGTNTNIHEQKVNEYKKDEFISIASHELKTPLTTIKAFFQMMQRDMNKSTIPGVFATKAERQLNRLGRLIEDLLDVSKINAGKMSYNKEEFDFDKMLTEMVESIQQTTSSHHIELHTNCRLMYLGDQHRIEQVIINLLNNAIKYSPDKNKVIVRCELDEHNLVVSVQDFGIGIAERHLKGLFDRFYRVDNSSSRFQGLGLGLFISNEIVKRHGGSFWIESKPEEGSTFYFLLPLSGKQEFNKKAGDGERFYESNFINMSYHPDQKYIDVDWLGYQNYDSVVNGCEIMLEILKKNRSERVLNDNTNVKGNWSEAADWGSEVWFPAMAAAGLKKFAWIYSSSTFSRIAANKSLPSAFEEVQVAFFDNKEEARNWLLSS